MTDPGLKKAYQKPSGHTDFRIALSTLETEIAKGNLSEKYKNIIKNPKNWSKISLPQKMKWARLAQMAGEMETAIAVFDNINKTSPEHIPGWQEHISLLMILGNRKQAAVITALAKSHIRKEDYDHLPSSNFINEKDKNPDATDEISTPFNRLRIQQQRIERFTTLFSGRADCFARQWVNRDEGRQGYVPVRKPFTVKDAEDHIRGRRTYGIYLLKKDSSVSLGVIDADITADFRKEKLNADMRRTVRKEKIYMIDRIKKLSRDTGLMPLTELSGNKGFHFWFFFNPPVPAGRIRSILNYITTNIAPDLSAFSLEVFPKQDRLSGKGFGNLVKLPLGIHRLTGKQSYFPECSDRSMDAQLDFLASIKAIDADNISLKDNTGNMKSLVVHPVWKSRTQKYPELDTLEINCPPLGQILSICRGLSAPTQREERILLQTIGFLPRARTLLHHIFGKLSDYNPHLVDFKLSRLRGTPLGCRKIHSLMSFSGDFCEFEHIPQYPHPLLHIAGWQDNDKMINRSQNITNLDDALENLAISIKQVLKFMPVPKR